MQNRTEGLGHERAGRQADRSGTDPRGRPPVGVPSTERPTRALLFVSMGINQESDPQRVALWINDFAATFLGARLAAVILTPHPAGPDPSVYGALDGRPLDPGTEEALRDLVEAEAPQPVGTNLFLDDLSAIPALAEHGLRFGLRARMRTMDVVFGTLVLGLEEEPRLGAEERFIIPNLTNQGTVALERIRARDEIEKRKAELEGLTGRLENTNTEMSRLTSGIAHDLAEPLRQISAGISFLARRYEGPPDRDIDEYLGFARDGVERMRTLVEALSEYSRAGSRARPFGPTYTDAVVADVIRVLSPSAKELETKVTSDRLPEVWGDPVELGRVFQNLLANTLRFARPGTPPVVHISASREGKGWRFSVTDNGVGIEPGDHDRIFHLFERAHRGAERGAGIGLATCRRIVERHGGRIWVKSTPGHGSTFHFTIPDGPKGFQTVPGEP